MEKEKREENREENREEKIENKSIKTKSNYVIKAIIVAMFFAGLLFVTVESIKYSINHNVPKMVCITEDNLKHDTTGMLVQITIDSLNRYDSEVHPIDYLKTAKKVPIEAKKGEAILLTTDDKFLVETKKTDKPIYMKCYKDYNKSSDIEFKPDIKTLKDRYNITFKAPNENGSYIYYIILKYNKYNVEYMFELEVK
ncbi:MAG: hypothetical protein RR988_03340 [Clostridia bacterium]